MKLLCSTLAIIPNIRPLHKSLCITVVSPRYRSFCLFSSLNLIRLCGLVFLVTAYQIGSSITLLEKYLLHIHSHNHFQNAIIFSSKIACSIKNGLNLALLLILLKHKMRFISNNPIGVGIICEGRIASTKGYMTTNMNVSSVGSFSNRIIDIAIIESISALGKLSVKLGVII